MEDPPGLPHCPQGKQDQSTAAPVNLRFAPLVSGLPFRPGAAPPELLEHQPGKQHFCFHPRTPGALPQKMFLLPPSEASAFAGGQVLGCRSLQALRLPRSHYGTGVSTLLGVPEQG